jgi:hypothetical protein
VALEKFSPKSYFERVKQFYDFEKNSAEFGRFLFKTLLVHAKNYHNIGLREKSHFLPKIGKKC